MSLVALNPALNLRFTHATSYAGAADERPILEVEVAAVSASGVLLGKPLTTSVLVDSGADKTMLDGGLAATLGIDLSGCPRTIVGGVGAGGVDVAVASVKMHLCSLWLDIPVHFTVNKIGHPQLLGRSGAFESVVWTFIHRHKVLLSAAA